MADHARSSDPEVQRQLDRFAQLSPGRDILGLERITALLATLGNPHHRLPPVFHVAGTNGKGSTCAFLRAALEAAGLRVHVYTSPHLVRFNERIRVVGSLITDAELAPLLAEVLNRAEAYAICASFFEATTAAALLAFSRTPADACVIEVGLGGRLDATNIVTPIVCGIAQVGIDHQAFLGDTLAEIASEKAGIAKPDVPLVCLNQLPAALTAITKIAAEARAPLLLEGRNWQIDETLHPSLPGMHQRRNANLAAQMLRVSGLASDTAIRAGIAAARWPARLQHLAPGPFTARLPGREIIIDGGHNADAAQAVAADLGASAPFDLIFGLLANRRIADVLGPIAPLVRTLYAVPLIDHDHHDPREIMNVAQGLFPAMRCRSALSLDEAIDEIAAEPGTVTAAPLLVMGSLYLAGDVLSLNDEAPD